MQQYRLPERGTEREREREIEEAMSMEKRAPIKWESKVKGTKAQKLKL
jgi:hypothetical protein